MLAMSGSSYRITTSYPAAYDPVVKQVFTIGNYNGDEFNDWVASGGKLIKVNASILTNFDSYEEVALPEITLSEKIKCRAPCKYAKNIKNS